MIVEPADALGCAVRRPALASVSDRKGEEMAHPNEDRFRAGYKAFQAGDMEALRNEYFSQDVVWHASGRNPLAGDYKGLD